MNRSLLQRLRRLEALFPERRPDFSGVSMRDLEALERHYEGLFSRTDIGGGPESDLPIRLQRVLRKIESGG